MCWTRRHLFQQYKSGLLKSYGCGIATFNFIVSMFKGARSKSLVGSLIVSTVNGPEFRIPFVSATSVSRDSSSDNFPCVEKRDDSIIRAGLICLSQTPPIWLAAGGLLIYFTKSPPRLCMKDWILPLLISLYVYFSWFSHPTKLVLLSEYNTFIFPLRAVTCLSACLKESLFKLWIISMCTARLAIHVNMAPQRLISFLRCLITNGPSISIPQYVKGGLLLVFSLEGLPSFVTLVCLFSLRHFTHLNKRL